MKRHLLPWLTFPPMLLLSACTPQLTTFDVPSQVAAHDLAEVTIVGLTSQSLAQGRSGCVLQIPNGFAVADWRLDYSGGSYSLAVDDPTVLGLYTPEPGHYLMSWSGSSSGGTPMSLEARLRVFLKAPATQGSHQLKLSLVGGVSSWQVVAPPAVTSFAAITAAPHVQPISVVAAPTTAFTLPASAMSFLSFPGLADVDEDGDADVIGPAEVWHSDPGPAWNTLTPLPASTNGAESGDFDGDGFVDLVTNTGQVWFGNGGANWTTGPLLSGIGPYVTTGDVDGDGRCDVLLSNAYGAMRMHFGNADRTFTLANNGLIATDTPGPGPFSPPSAYGLLLADVTGDGLLDVCQATSVNPTVWIGNGGSGWTTATGLPTTIQRPGVGRLDGAPTPALFLFGDSVQAFRYLGAGAFGAVGTGLPASSVTRGAVVDVDVDGLADLVIVQSTGGMQLYRNDGSGSFSADPASGLSTLGFVSDVRAADLDGNGALDLCVNEGLLSRVYLNTTETTLVRAAHACNGQTLEATGTGALGTTLSFAIGGSTGFPAIGLGTTVLSVPLCGSCVLGHNWEVLYFGATYQLSVPNTPTLSGAQVAFQSADVFAASGCLGIPVSFGDTLVLTVP